MILLQDSPLLQSDIEMSELIMYKCKNVFNIHDISVKDRHQNMIDCRRLAIWLHYKHTNMNVYQIAKLLNLSRSTVIFHYGKIQSYIDSNDKRTMEMLDRIGDFFEELV